MAKKTPQNYHYRYSKLIMWGMLTWEAREIARNYSMEQIRTLPYLQNMLKGRRLFVINLRRRDYSDTEIRDRIFALYDIRDWLTDDGRTDVWKMIRYYRRDTIQGGDYFPAKRKGTHHPPDSGISKGDLKSQKARRKKKLSELEKYDRGRMR